MAKKIDIIGASNVVNRMFEACGDGASLPSPVPPKGTGEVPRRPPVPKKGKAPARGLGICQLAAITND